GLMSLVRGSTSLGDVAGPIGMGQLTSEIISRSAMPLWVTLTNLTIILSLNLALLNLLPLPALDGGRLLFVLIEVLRGGKRVPPEKEGVVHFVGLMLLLTAMFLIAFVDINRIISGSSFLE
ncbi:MAG TPA: RIP metalloprotease RseP, partial [Chloroflexi bacterium]|nr:RIP metalloprotease RseP [Chloroflexota bacterium]